MLREEIERAARGSACSTSVTIDIFTSPGGYILGEESALIECMEGHRGEPRNKPPFPGGYGLWGKPTLMNNVETFAAVPVILERGARLVEGRRASTAGRAEVLLGLRPRRAARRVLRARGHARRRRDRARRRRARRRRGSLRRPARRGVDELPRARLPRPAADFDAIAEAGSALGTGAMVVIAEGTDLLAAATNVLSFFRNESCGKCVPCRVGSTKAHTILSELLERGGGRGRRGRARSTSSRRRCGSPRSAASGQVALGPVIVRAAARRARRARIRDADVPATASCTVSAPGSASSSPS